MSAAGDGFAGVAADLKAAETKLDTELSRLEAWRALRQLEERETRGDGLQAIDAGRLKASLQATLDQQAPQWRALPALRDAIARLTGDTAQTSVRAGSALPEGSPSPEGPAKVRVKIKASSLAMVSSATPPSILTPNVTLRPEPDPPASPAPEPPALSGAVAQKTVDSSPPSVPVAPPMPAPERRLRDLGRIRNVDQVLLGTAKPPPAPAQPSAPGPQDRFGGALPWSSLGEPPPPPAPTDAARLPMGGEQPVSSAHLGQGDAPAPAPTFSVPAETPALASDAPPKPPTVRGFAASVAKSLPVPTLGARGLGGDARSAERDGIDTFVDIVSSPRAGPTITDHRLSDLEAGLDALIGRRKPHSQSTSRDESRVDEIDVDEAEVEIVREQRSKGSDPAAPLAPPSPSAPVALSIRLKEPERTVEFDATGYEAYRTDIEEAEVEIVRPAKVDAVDRPRLEQQPQAPAARRFLKVLSSE